MIWPFDFLVLLMIVICAFAAISLKGLLSAGIILSAYSFLMALLWTEMGAVDVAFTEAAVGAGVSTVFIIAVIFHTRRRLKPRQSGRILFKLIGLSASVALGALLLDASNDFPAWADPAAPAGGHVATYYVNNTLSDTGAPNVVTSVLADYRGFDTLFETTVIFAAGMVVIAVLRRPGRRKNPRRKTRDGKLVEAHTSLIIQRVARIMIPFMQLYGLYVVAHGHHSPGGGFQGGVIIGSSFILVGLSYNVQTVVKRMNEKLNILLANAGVLVFAGIGTLCILLGGNFLDYSVLSRILPATSPVMARYHGMLGVEIGVAIAVMAIMVTIYVNAASKGYQDQGL